MVAYLSGALSLLTWASCCAAAPPGLWFWGSGSNESIDAIVAHRTELADGPPVLYSIGAGGVAANGSFTRSGSAATVARLKAANFGVHAIIGCGSIDTLRRLFSNPNPFITAAVAAAKDLGLDGYNLDFEPYGAVNLQAGVTNDDGLAYAAFIDKFAAALHAQNMELSVDYFSNLAIWNLGAMNSTE